MTIDLDKIAAENRLRDYQNAKIEADIRQGALSNPNYATAWAVLQLVETLRTLKVALHTNRQD